MTRSYQTHAAPSSSELRQQLDDCVRCRDQLQTALDSRVIVEQAKGVLHVDPVQGVAA